MSSGRAKYLASILNWCGGRLAFEEGGTNKGGRSRVTGSRGQKEPGERKNRVDFNENGSSDGTKAQFYRITFNKFRHSQIKLPISEKE